ncbi:MAG: HTH domain-containing protein [Chloroflexota bacterium]
MRADRLLTMIVLLQRHQHMTAKALSESLGVTERTIYRDIEALSMAGVPVYTQPGPGGGCYLDEGYRNTLAWFGADELQALAVGANATALADLGIDSTAGHAVLKLLANVSARGRTDAAAAGQRLYLDGTGWYGPSDAPDHLATLKAATWADEIIEADYQTWEGKPVQRRLAPYSLVHKANAWYLVAAKADAM